MKKNIILFVLLIPFTLLAQKNLILSFTDFMRWTPNSPFTVPENVAKEPLKPRVAAPHNHTVKGLNPKIKVVYCPDWINNFVPELGVHKPFNKYFFTQWQYIDIFVWFHGGGVVIPHAPWINTAHKNGVKVIGTVMFYPDTPGMSSFLQQDGSGNYIGAQKLIDLAQYYGFDGWLFNFEQRTSSATASKCLELMNQFISQSKGSLELIWYDAMTESGSLSYQNELNGANDEFFKKSTGIFTNYWWGSSHVTRSVSRARQINGDVYKVYTGADMWPDRTAQAAFSDKTWPDKICSSGTNNFRTSVALFATNFTFEWRPFSNFLSNPNDYIRCYETERIIFSGQNKNPYIVQANTYKGLSNYITPKTAITKVPFKTNFNTGHGKKEWKEGVITSNEGWYNMDKQELLPTWTFYKNTQTGFQIEYSFDDAYNGGTSIVFNASDGSDLKNEVFKLYKTSIPLNIPLAVKLNGKYSSSDNNITTTLVAHMSSGKTQEIALENSGSTWFQQSLKIPSSSGDTLMAIGFTIQAQNNALSQPYTFSLGQLEIIKEAVAIKTMKKKDNYGVVFSGTGLHRNIQINIDGKKDQLYRLNIYSVNGRLVQQRAITNGVHPVRLQPGFYIFDVHTREGIVIKRGKIILNN